MTVCIHIASVQSGDEVSSASSAFLYIWVVSAFTSTCYTFIWDVRMDWGLFDKNAGDNRYLREEIVYSRKVSAAVVVLFSVFLQHCRALYKVYNDILIKAKVCIALHETPSQSHATQVNTPHLSSRQTSWYSMYIPQRDGRLS